MSSSYTLSDCMADVYRNEFWAIDLMRPLWDGVCDLKKRSITQSRQSRIFQAHTTSCLMGNSCIAHMFASENNPFVRFGSNLLGVDAVLTVADQCVHGLGTFLTERTCR